MSNRNCKACGDPAEVGKFCADCAESPLSGRGGGGAGYESFQPMNSVADHLETNPHRRCQAIAADGRDCQGVVYRNTRYCHPHQHYTPEHEKYRGLAKEAGVNVFAAKRVVDALIRRGLG